MNAIIIDDDIFFCKVIREYCLKTDINVISEFQNPITALKYLKDNKGDVDIIFLDIHMPNLNGFEVIKSAGKSQIIITSTDQSKAIEAFDHDVIDFLLKPINFERFVRAVNRVPNNNEEKKAKDSIDHIFVNINKRLIKVKTKNIDYVTAKGNYVLVTLFKGDNLIVHTTLRKIKETLPKEQFAQVHRSYIINITQIVDIEDSTIVIGKSVIPLGKNYRENLLDRLNLLT